MIINVEIYNNHIRQVKEFDLTCLLLEEKLRQIKYKGEGLIKDEAVEAFKLPPIALTFYSLIYEMGNIPTDDLLIEEYFKQEYFNYVPDGKIEVCYESEPTILSMEGIMARVQRTYPSLIRDLHFYLLLLESNRFEAVRYSFLDDYAGKVDIRVKYNGTWYNVGLMLGTKRSFWYKFKKQFRHKNVDVIYLELFDEDAKFCGDFKLFTEKHIDMLMDNLKRNKWRR